MWWLREERLIASPYSQDITTITGKVKRNCIFSGYILELDDPRKVLSGKKLGIKTMRKL
jgi:hypothetical protein